MGIEPTSSAWKAEVLPLNYTRGNYLVSPAQAAERPARPLTDGRAALSDDDQTANHRVYFFLSFQKLMVEGGGFEPPKLARQIYSLIPLATREPLRKAAHCPDEPSQCQLISREKRR